MSIKEIVLENAFKLVVQDWSPAKQETFLTVYPMFEFRSKMIDLWIDIYQHNNKEYTEKKKSVEKKKSTSNICRSMSKSNNDRLEKICERRTHIIKFLEKAVSENYIQLSQIELTKLTLALNNNDSDENKGTIELLRHHTNKREFDLVTPQLSLVDNDEIITFETIDTKVLAKLITIQISKIMDLVTSHELIEAALNYDYNEDLCPNLFKLKTLFKKYGNWAPTEILINSNTKQQRITAINKFLDLCSELKNLKNYYIYFAIIGGLDNIAIQRLDYLWKQEEEMKKTFVELSQLVCPIYNFKNYRAELQIINTEEPVLPFLGIITSDIQHSLEMTFVTKNKEFNWRVYKNVALQVKYFKSCNKNYDFDIDSLSIYNYLVQLDVCNDDEKFYTISKQIQGNKSTPNVGVPENNALSASSTSLTSTASTASTTPTAHEDSISQIMPKSGSQSFSMDSIKERPTVSDEICDQKPKIRSLSLSMDSKRKSQINIDIFNLPTPSPKSFGTFSPESVFVEQWSQDKVLKWLITIGLSEYTSIFAQNNITGFELVELDAFLLSEMGIKSVGDKIKILKHIKLEHLKNSLSAQRTN